MPDIESPAEVMAGIAARVRARRLETDLTQKAFAARAGIPLATYRRFERTGETSLKNLILMAGALDMADDFSVLFSRRRYRDIEEVINGRAAPPRKRGRRND
jgi:transcriptional regulator with XRE-family HTH domain